eukprot:TRINITY_DN6398_c0_g2_i1.p2 TRINITY_DN6398_c0_g2~~TRINITY_DN6398_c0_g2_i1.p2  ORF type:complete len:465 (-),score=135.25 TRINITY_DN6398_c0_g2_i1:2613-4007(-)
MELKSGIINVPEQTKRTADKAGYMIKQGGKWKTWKRRYFILKDNFLYYFADPKDAIPKGVILLNAVQIDDAEKPTKRKLCFSVHTKKSFTAKTAWNDRVYFFQAELADDMNQWKKALLSAVPGNQLPHTPQMTEEAKQLFRACGKGDTVAIKSLLQHNIDLTITDDQGNTPMHWACVGGHVEAVKLLLENITAGGIEMKSRDGFTPMHSVAQEDHRKVLELLIEKGAKMDVPNTEDNGNTTLHYAACWGAVECTKLLIAKGAPVDAVAQDKSTPLSFAAEKGHVEIAKLLIEAGASLESKNDPEEKGGATPLLLAAHNGQLDIVKLLISKGANLKETTIDGLNCLHLAIRSGADNNELIKVLIEGGAGVNAKTNNGDSPMHYAAYMGYAKAAAVLAENGAQLEERGQNDSTPLHFAAREGKYDVIKMLLDKGADPSPKDKDGDTPLSCAELNGHARCADLLKSK